MSYIIWAIKSYVYDVLTASFHQKETLIVIMHGIQLLLTLQFRSL